MKINPMRDLCGAQTRSGVPCRAPKVTGRNRCRMHGGAFGSGAPKGERNGNYRHGRLTCEAIAQRTAVRNLVQASREMLVEIAKINSTARREPFALIRKEKNHG